MRQIRLLYASVVLVIGWGFAAQPAVAQDAANNTSPTGSMRSTTLQPQSLPPENLPPALPGMGAGQALNAGPSLVKPQTGDPTAQLFNAINSNDYNSAQDAISRGADIDAQNALGETPLDLSVSLNRNSITFMLLSNRTADGSDSGATVSGTPSGSVAPSTTKTAAVPIKLIEAPNQPTVPGNNPGVPNPAAGFLGFGSTR